MFETRKQELRKNGINFKTSKNHLYLRSEQSFDRVFELIKKFEKKCYAYTVENRGIDYFIKVETLTLDMEDQKELNKILIDSNIFRGV